MSHYSTTLSSFFFCLARAPQRKSKYTEAKLKALKARNEYILCLEASNTTIHKYFVDDLSDLIDVSTAHFTCSIPDAQLFECNTIFISRFVRSSRACTFFNWQIKDANKFSNTSKPT